MRRFWMCRWLPLLAFAACCGLVCGPALAQELPWKHQGKKPEGKPGALSPREMLKLLQVDDSHWDLLRDGQPPLGEESETLTRLLFRMPRFDPPQWDRWCREEADLQELARDPRPHRASAYVVKGRAQKVEVVELLPELVPLYEFRHYYRVTLAVEDAPHPIVISTRAIPAAASILWRGLSRRAWARSLASRSLSRTRPERRG